MNLPKVSIVVLGYLESNRKYLAECLASVRNLYYPKELLDIIVVSPYWPGAVRSTRANNFSGSVNAGVAACDPESKHILLLSDDTIIANGALKAMVEAAGDNECLMGALSNCDQYWKYQLHLPHVSLPKRFYKLEEVNPRELMNAESYYPGGILMTDTLCFYALLIPRKVWDKVGELDEDFNMGFEDSDYCERAKELGIPCAIAMDAIIYHAGGATSEIIRDEWRVKNERLFHEKRALRAAKKSG